MTKILETGYINGDMQHGMINIDGPVLSNLLSKQEFIQIVLKIEDLIKLRDSINEFIFQHNSKLN